MAKLQFNLPNQGVNQAPYVDKTSANSSVYMNNVRVQDVLEGRYRLGQRPGLKKWSNDLTTPVVAMAMISFVEN